ncbi:hypothetical protein CGMCC3_g7125 [Colletotrichum fructicola]|nr:uncharacterized protein CGMCC3_g7125 [Colletotrichum fructicola]KAE9576675.1 hypothetical protein CGMCC3_g7125 [Colletotrichum fructicola]
MSFRPSNSILSLVLVTHFADILTDGINASKQGPYIQKLHILSSLDIMVCGTSSSSLRCTNIQCNSTFSTRSNMNRHIKSKHGPKVRAACGKEFLNQPWNIKRHMSTCNECKKTMDHHSISTSSEKKKDDDGSLPPYDFLSSNGVDIHYDARFEIIFNDDADSWGCGEYSCCLECE